MRTLAVIPARGGSKGLPGKNARPFLGVSLLERAISIAQETCDDLIVTTDSPALARLARGRQERVRMRPADLATDEAPMLPVVQDAIRGLDGDVIVLLQPTQPLRTADQVRQAIEMLVEPWESVVSVRRVPMAYAPDRMLHEDERFGLVEAIKDFHDECPQRQAARQAYYRDGTVYVTRRSEIEESRYFGRMGSLYGIHCRPLILEGDAPSIDTEEDFLRLEALARQGIIEESLADAG